MTVSLQEKGSAQNSGPGDFTLRSNDFEDNGRIPSRFTCDGEDISPHLEWINPPEGTRSFALDVSDPDAPGGTFIHWLVYNIPGSTRELRQGALPAEAEEVENHFGKKSYGGPCPPSGTHRYIFTLYALNIGRLEDVSQNSFFEKVEKATITKTKLTGLYSRI